MRILHLVTDWLFTDCVISVFETFGEKSKFAYLGRTEKEAFEHIKRTDAVEAVLVNSERYKELQRENFDYVWVHFANSNHMDFVNGLPQGGPKVIWSSWGLDYVCQLGMPLYLKRTLVHYLAHQPFRDSVKYVIGRILFVLKLDRFRWRPIYKNFFDRVSYFSSVFREEHSLLRRMVRRDAVAVDFHYVGKGAIDYPRCDGSAKRMWIGNSATYSNNHFDILAKAKKYKDWEVVAPLVYGEIKDDIDAYGRKLFGERWRAIVDFMPFAEYKNLMAQCSVFVFGHRRQQSIGNISIALRVGGCVFLEKKNVSYWYFKNNGMRVYTLNDFENRLEESLKDFAPYREENIKRMETFRDRELLIQEIRQTMDRLSADAEKC